jgi:hypothetical protein
LTSGILVIFLAALEILPGLILLRLPLLPDAELLLDGLLTLLDLLRMLLRVLLGVILQLVELAHDAPPVPMSGSPGLSPAATHYPMPGAPHLRVPTPAIAAVAYGPGQPVRSSVLKEKPPRIPFRHSRSDVIITQPGSGPVPLAGSRWFGRVGVLSGAPGRMVGTQSRCL